MRGFKSYEAAARLSSYDELVTTCIPVHAVAKHSN
jgi:hypothetical protein